MDLSGRSMKSLREAVNRIQRHWFTAELHAVGELDAGVVADLDDLGARWRDDSTERGLSPANAFERAAARVLRLADSWFQFERLLHFNAKFGPRWEPRHPLFAGPAQLPRVAIGALLAEGHLPALLLPRRDDIVRTSRPASLVTAWQSKQGATKCPSAF
jgi:lysylphosphatidylglycerol synthetase-like protein (DUF2156 family)